MRKPKPSIRFIAAALALLPTLSLAEPPVTVRLHETRDFGYVIGDLVTQRISVSATAPLRLALDHLPIPGPIRPWLDVRNVKVSEHARVGGTDYEITLTYQVFYGAKEPGYLKIPELPLRFQDGDRGLDANLPEWQFGYAPLIPSHIRDDEVAVRASQETELIKFGSGLRRLGALSAASALILLYLAWFYDWLPLLHRRAGPFTRAARHIRALSRKPFDPERYRRALQHFHQALNETAGETVFAGTLIGFYARQPQFTTLRPPTERFFEHSTQVFFGNAADTEENFPLAELERLCRKYRNIERSLK
ncbi:MAG: hypothetical protein ABFS02_07315 [Pseudomonadota bacterium]